jgi:arylsulfatase A-like enzyme
MKKNHLVRSWAFSILVFLSISLIFIHCNKKRAARKILSKKQIILISVDTLRADHLSFNGYNRETAPNLSDFVNDSVFYKNAYTNGCWTMPAHMSLLTGTLPSRHGINRDWTSIHNKEYPVLNEAIQNIAEILKSQKIHTIKFAKLPDELGFRRGFNINFRNDPFFIERKWKNLLKEIEENREKDFFLFIHTWMAHAPYSNSYYLKNKNIEQEQQKYIDNFRKIKRKSKNLAGEFSAFLKENGIFKREYCVDLYDSGIRYVDGYIGDIINKTKQLGIYHNMMFIVVSDHGEHFEEHYKGKFYNFHGRNYYEEFIKVPLIIKYPGTGKGKIIENPVSLIDVLPTILDYYKIKIPGFIQGNSLLGYHQEGNPKYIISEAVAIAGIERKMIRIGNLKYIITMQNPAKTERVNWNSIKKRELYDLEADPLECNDLYGDLKFRQICIDFEKILYKIIKDSASKNFHIKKTKIKKETLKQLEALGYL